jgi:hypothetical protein
MQGICVLSSSDFLIVSIYYRPIVSCLFRKWHSLEVCSLILNVSILHTSSRIYIYIDIRWIKPKSDKTHLTTKLLICSANYKKRRKRVVDGAVLYTYSRSRKSHKPDRVRKDAHYASFIFLLNHFTATYKLSSANQ